MKPDGLGWLYAPAPSRTARCRRTTSRSSRRWATCSTPGRRATRRCAFSRGRSTRIAHTPTAEYPVVATTFRLTEHYLSGPMSRFNSWLNELQPEMFVELSPELAAERGIVHGGWLTVQSARGRIEARAMVTRRLRPLLVEGRVVHQIGLPVPLGLRRRDRRRQRQRPDLAGGRPEREHARGQGVRLPGPRRPARRPRARARRSRWRPGRRASRSPTRPAAAQPEGRFGHGK